MRPREAMHRRNPGVKEMRRYWVFLTSLAGTVAIADTPIDETLDADDDGEVIVSNVAGSVDISGWSQNRVNVTGTLGDGVEELIFERDGDEVLIKVKLPRHNSRRGSSDLVIKVPEDSSLKVNTVSADIDVVDVHGEQRLDSVSGDIVTELYGPEIDAETVSGDIEVSGNEQEADIKLDSVSGDIEIKDLSGELRAESVSGDIESLDGTFSRIQGNTVNGDIVIRAGLEQGGRIDLETINGEVELEFIGDVSAEFNIETFNGAIRNCFGPEPVRTSRYAPGNELDFTEGGGTGRVRIQTLNGTVDICK